MSKNWSYADMSKAAKGVGDPELVVQCTNCGRTAYGIDEINVIFGFEKNESGGIEPNTKCKRCCTN